MGFSNDDQQAGQDVHVSLSQTWAFPWWRRVSLHPHEEGLISQLLPEQSSEAFEVYHIIVTSQVNSI